MISSHIILKEIIIKFLSESEKEFTQFKMNNIYKLNNCANNYFEY